ncbi:helix-turn-helix domain-containing protein [Novosphingobium sp. PhB57]|uniref:helix-turn-helix domain-containing protein n=1 Tax=Novosphingobium sp. PhB57 TaxID=2485107 RepID=UPI001A9FAD5A|nr:helix-turn-helix domain-containing protein [Novosphingobium sp. PhB57]
MMSPGYFIKAFSSTVGIAPYAWLIEQRLAMACSLIDSSVYPLAQIALDCGFFRPKPPNANIREATGDDAGALATMAARGAVSSFGSVILRAQIEVYN